MGIRHVFSGEGEERKLLLRSIFPNGPHGCANPEPWTGYGQATGTVDPCMLEDATINMI